MCVDMFLTDKEAAEERAIIRTACAINGEPAPDGLFFARVTINDPTNPEINGLWYATTRQDFHWALTENPEHAHPLRAGNGDNIHDAQSEVEFFIGCLERHNIRTFKKVELVLRTGEEMVVVATAQRAP